MSPGQHTGVLAGLLQGPGDEPVHNQVQEDGKPVHNQVQEGGKPVHNQVQEVGKPVHNLLQEDVHEPVNNSVQESVHKKQVLNKIEEAELVQTNQEQELIKPGPKGIPEISL